MDDNATTGDGRRRVSVVAIVSLIVVDNIAASLVPNLDSELVYATPAIDLAVCGSEYEAVASSPINRPGTLVLSLYPSNNKPIIAGAVEIQIGHAELELGLPGWNIGTLLVLRNKAKGGLSGKVRLSIGSRWGIKPAAAGNEPCARVINDNVMVDCLCRCSCRINYCQGNVVDASLLLKQNVHPAVVQQRLGHASIATTIDVYSHIMPGLQAAAANGF
ncbi:MAG: hypothetical protein Q8Q07_04790 [Dehalococcoidales bacterium]|nr:hypothetical protein [Dehalococcoidales bacterium]